MHHRGGGANVRVHKLASTDYFQKQNACAAGWLRGGGSGEGMRSALKNVKGRTVTGVTVELLGSKGARLLCANRTSVSSGGRRAAIAGAQGELNDRGGAHRRNLSRVGADLSMKKGSRSIQLSDATVFNL